MELDELTYRTTVHQVVEELKKNLEQIIQFLERCSEQELDQVAAGMKAARLIKKTEE